MIDNITKLREVELELLKEFDRVCEEHNLRWCIFFGTLLGAMRNGGFLPWDDDVDVVMPEDDYITLCQHKEWFEDEFFLQTPIDKGFLHFAKLRKNGTTAFRADFIRCLRNGGHQGIAIDIIPLAEMPGSGSYHTPTLGWAKAQAVYLKEWIEPFGKITFEGMEVNCPSKSRKVLTESYEFWAWPDGAQKCMPCNWFFDTETGYEVYYKRYTGMLDGIEGKKIFLFGAADSLRIFLERFGLRNQVDCTFDNDPGKWGKKVFDVEVRDPAEIPKLLDENGRLIIVSVWHQEIGRQVESMGISDYYVYLDGYYDENVGNKVVRREDMQNGKSVIPMWNG